MYKFVLALGLAGTVIAAPLHAQDMVLTFQPVAPEGLDASAMEMVESLQAGLPAQMPAFQQAGYGYFGAVAVPQGVELRPDLLASVANLENVESAETEVLKLCQEQTGQSCTVIGLLVPAES